MLKNDKVKNNLLHEKEVARLLNISPKTLQNWRVKGQGPTYIKMGYSVRYEPSVIQEYILHHRKSSTSAPIQPTLNFNY